MKKLVSFIVVLCLLLSCMGMCAVYATYEKIYGADNLNNEDGDLVIGFIGGSITEGSGASSIKNRYSSLVVEDYFRKNFPNKNVIELNKSIGGTGSDYGHIRMLRNFGTQNPDVVFIEFAVNDIWGGKISLTQNMESMVRQLLALPKIPVIIFVYTTSEKSLNMNGTSYSSVENSINAFHAVAQQYGIYEINLNDYVWQGVKDGKWSWDKTKTDTTLTKDNTHPNDKGYRVYADRITECLTADKSIAFAKLDHHTLPCGQYVYGKLTPVHLSDSAVTIKGGNWILKPRNDSYDNVKDSKYPERYFKEGWFESSDCIGSSIEYSFTGRGIGIDFARRKDNAILKWEIFDQDNKSVSKGTYDGVYYKTDGARCLGVMLKTGLPYGNYKAVFTFEKNQQAIADNNTNSSHGGSGTYGSIAYIVIESTMPEIFPVAENVKITSESYSAGCKQEGNYSYSTYTGSMIGFENYTQNGTTSGWYLSSNESSVGEMVQEGTEYTPSTSDIGKYLRYGVTPKNSMGTVGKVYFSKPVLVSRPLGQVTMSSDIVRKTQSEKESASVNINNQLDFAIKTSLVLSKYTVNNGFKTLTDLDICTLEIPEKDNKDFYAEVPQALAEEYVSTFAFCTEYLESVSVKK